MGERVYSLICLIILICIGYSESQTYAENHCRQYYVPCDNRECIDRLSWCDGQVDCGDMSDEAYCKEASWYSFKGVDHKCTQQHFECYNKQCVPIVTLCDGYMDCKDDSDEASCDTNTSEMPSTTEDNNSRDELDKESDEDSWKPFETNETPFPSNFQQTSPPVIAPTLPATTDYYHMRFNKESVNRQTHSVRGSESSYNSYPAIDQRRTETNYGSRDYSQDPIVSAQQPLSPSTTGRQSKPQQPRQFTTRPINTESRLSPDGQISHHTQTYQSPHQRSRASDTAPTSSFPLNDVRSLPVGPQPNSVSITRQKIVPTPFHFRINYTHRYEYRYKDIIQRTERWLIDQRNTAYTWGKDTPRALVALSLINNNFMSNIPENSFMKKGLQAHLGVKLLTELKANNCNHKCRNGIKLAQYINALLATCQDPWDFLGKNLVDSLWQMKNNLIAQYGSVNPFIYITLCLADAPITLEDAAYLMQYLPPNYSDESSRDKQILATTAIACFQHNNPEFRLDEVVNNAFNDLLDRKLPDGSFGSIYTTALAAQALMSINNSWDETQTLNFLVRNQTEDGSFGDMLATYYILPVLSGRSLLHLRNTQCDPPLTDKDDSSILDLLNHPGYKIRVFYVVKIGFPTTTSLPIYVSVPPDTNFFDIMRIIELLAPVFKFSYKVISPNKFDVHTISNIPNDPERGTYWHLYPNASRVFTYPYQHEEYTGDIRELYPTDGQELVYWYHNLY